MTTSVIHLQHSKVSFDSGETLSNSATFHQSLLENVNETGRKYTIIFVQKLYIMHNEVRGHVSIRLYRYKRIGS